MRSDRGRLRRPTWIDRAWRGRMRVAPALLGAIAAASTMPTAAQSVEASASQARVGQPFAATLRVRAFEWPAHRVQPDCLDAEVTEPDTGREIRPLRIRAVPAGDDDRALVLLSSPARVSEPVLRVVLTVRCGAEFTREMTLLAEPPDGRPAPAAPAAPDRPAPRPRPASPVTPTPPPPESPRESAALQANGITSAIAAAPLPASAIDPQTLAEAIAAALRAQPAAPPGPDPADVPWKTLLADQDRTRAGLAALQTQIEQSERSRWRDTMVAAVTVAALVLARLARGLLHESRISLPGWRRHRSRPIPRSGPPPHPSRPHPEPPQDVRPVPLAHAEIPVSPARPPAGTLAPMEWSPPQAGPADRDGDPPSRWPDADFGKPTLDTLASADLLLELAPHMPECPIGCAIVLERRLQERDGKCPGILLALLDLYRQLAQPWNQERVAAQIEALYHVRIGADPSPAPSAAWADETPDAEWEGRLVTIWNQDDPAEALARLILRPPHDPGRDLPRPPPLSRQAFESAVFLHALAMRRMARSSLPDDPGTPDFRPRALTAQEVLTIRAAPDDGVRILEPEEDAGAGWHARLAA
ncbi:MAG: hypothetical protein RL456_536 [Pseudomonadota bacterium]